ncbi:transcriptional regulator, TetR family [Geodermatophilus nigrescens]|uniref:Transcriptional regulator, TetR family n=1 Tax=Geodermatophilus nigrescens TaxID=1070870 RepID=A0A1M5MBJ5_9ACTN|nr:transcriptional regulator, TetR family [Geodermatophilus nigrescens]
MSVAAITTLVPVVRWQPDARGRLERAALELYAERGFDATTVAGIAERAGLTERTFFRHFADKREVLFGGSPVLQERLVAGLAAAPPSAGPLAAVGAALATIPETLPEERRAGAAQRQAVIDATPELRERELAKFAALTAAMAQGLRERGVGEPTASLAAEAGAAVFRVAFGRWIGGDARDLGTLLAASLAELRGVAADG